MQKREVWGYKENQEWIMHFVLEGILSCVMKIRFSKRMEAQKFVGFLAQKRHPLSSPSQDSCRP